MAALTSHHTDSRSHLMTTQYVPESAAPSSALQRRNANQYVRTLPLSAVGMYDWRINPQHYPVVPVVSGQHNAFPRRIPSAASDKLRQMYLKTDTISGRLAFNSAHERNRQKRWNVLQNCIEQQERELEERNREMESRSERSKQKSAPPPNVVSAISSRNKQSLIPPIKSWRGMTIIREKRRSRRPASDQEDETSQMIDVHEQHTSRANEKLSAEMSIYLPRADLTEQTYSIRETTPPNTPTSSAGYATSSTYTPRLRYTKRPSTHHINRPNKNNTYVLDLTVGNGIAVEQNSFHDDDAETPSSSRW